jgi:hypothetical protein
MLARTDSAMVTRTRPLNQAAGEHQSTQEMSAWLLQRRWRRCARRGTRHAYSRVRDRLTGCATSRRAQRCSTSGAATRSFGALDRVGPDSSVIFADVFSAVLDAAATSAEIDAFSAAFVRRGGRSLRHRERSSVDAVTARSV